MSCLSLTLSLLPSGACLAVYVTTGLTEDGSFWAQLADEDGKPYNALMEDLQSFAESEGLPSPAFLNPGDYCAAVYSEDGQWYRARVESSTGRSVGVRFIDFGNQEECGLGQVMRLNSRFRHLPFQAVHCSLSVAEHRTFSAKERGKFDEVVPLDERLEILVKHLEGAMATVELHLSTSPPVDLSDVIYTAGLSPPLSLCLLPPNGKEGPSVADCFHGWLEYWLRVQECWFESHPFLHVVPCIFLKQFS